MKLLFLITLNFLFITTNAINNNSQIPSNQESSDILVIKLPAKQLSLKTTKLDINYNYFVHGIENQAQIRITFNLLGTNCFAFKPFYAKINQDIKGSIPTTQCNISKPGTYYGVATICLKKSIEPTTYELCKTEAENILVK